MWLLFKRNNMKIKIISDVKWETPQVDFSVTMFPWRKEELAPERKKKNRA